MKDVKAAVDFAYKRFGKEEHIALYGFSLSASAMLMADVKVDAIISDSAYANLENMIKQVYKMFGPFKYPFVQVTDFFSIIFFRKHPKKVSPALAIKDSDIPIFVIHGEKDSQISVKNAYELKESNPNIEFWIVKGVDHGQAFSLGEYKKRVKDFLKKNMK